MALLLRERYLVRIPERAPLPSKEVLLMGYRPLEILEEPWIHDDEALHLLAEAKPDASLLLPEKRELVEEVLKEIGEWKELDGE